MKIVYHHKTLLDGAEGIHITEMIRAFEALGHTVITVSPAAAPGGGPAGRMAAAVRRAIPGGLFEVATTIHSMAESQLGHRLLKKIQPAFVYQRHALNDVGMLKAARHLGIPAVLEVNVLYSSQTLGQFEPLRFPRLARATERLALSLPKVIVAVSSPLKALVLDILPQARSVIVLPNAVDPVRFNPVVSGSVIRTRYDLPDSGLVVGWCGIMRSWHGVDVLVKALRSTSFFLLLVGDGPDRPRIEGMCRDLGLANRVRFTGRIPQMSMPEHVAAMDIGVVADDQTRYASPMKLLEYMAMGKPVVAPDLPNIRDVITDGDEGMLFEPGNSEALAERLTTLEDDALRRRLGARGRALVEADRNWGANAQRVLTALAAAGVTLPGNGTNRRVGA